MIPFRSRKYQRQQRLQSQTDIAQIASQWILRRDQLPEYRFAIELMESGRQRRNFLAVLGRAGQFCAAGIWRRAIFQEYWFRLIADYSELPLRKKGQALEALGYIHNPNVVKFFSTGNAAG